MAIHRMPAAASSTARPSLTKAKAKISTHDTAKNSVVVSTSQLFASIATSLRSTSQAVRRNMSVGSDQRAVARAQAARRWLVGEETAVADQRDPGDQAVGEIEVVRGQKDDGAAGGEGAQPIGDQTDGAIVEAGERLVEQHQPRRMQQRTLERQPLAHAAGKRADRLRPPTRGGRGPRRGGRT